jgi:hypothetical protein
MSVEVTTTGWCSQHHLGNPCSVCGNGVQPPFMAWEAETDILICGPCASRVKDGFAADLIHLAAIMELKKVQPEFGVTLARARVQDLEAKEKANNVFFLKNFQH